MYNFYFMHKEEVIMVAPSALSQSLWEEAVLELQGGDLVRFLKKVKQLNREVIRHLCELKKDPMPEVLDNYYKSIYEKTDTVAYISGQCYQQYSKICTHAAKQVFPRICDFYEFGNNMTLEARIRHIKYKEVYNALTFFLPYKPELFLEEKLSLREQDFFQHYVNNLLPMNRGMIASRYMEALLDTINQLHYRFKKKLGKRRFKLFKNTLIKKSVILCALYEKILEDFNANRVSTDRVFEFIEDAINDRILKRHRGPNFFSTTHTVSELQYLRANLIDQQARVTCNELRLQDYLREQPRHSHICSAVELAVKDQVDEQGEGLNMRSMA